MTNPIRGIDLRERIGRDRNFELSDEKEKKAHAFYDGVTDEQYPFLQSADRTGEQVRKVAQFRYNCTGLVWAMQKESHGNMPTRVQEKQQKEGTCSPHLPRRFRSAAYLAGSLAAVLATVRNHPSFFFLCFFFIVGTGNQIKVPAFITPDTGTGHRYCTANISIKMSFFLRYAVD